MLTKSCSKVAPKFLCIHCDYNTSKKSSYDKHTLTAKHCLLTSANNQVAINDLSLICANCNKIYKSRVGLWSHKKKCPHIVRENIYDGDCSNTATVENAFIPRHDNVLIIELLKQNQEFKELLIDQNEKMMEQNQHMMELAAKVGNTTNNNIKQQNNFNLHVFLNETCKDAVDINDFIKNLPVSFKQLENINQNGYVAGITDVILSQLKTMEITKRPLHCTDLKRDTMYIKEANEWVKDNDENTKMTQIFRRIAKKNVSYLHDWSDKNPDSLVTDTKENTFLINVLLHSLGVIGDAQIKLDNKVLKNISKIVHVGRNICE